MKRIFFVSFGENQCFSPNNQSNTEFYKGKLISITYITELSFFILFSYPLSLVNIEKKEGE